MRRVVEKVEQLVRDKRLMECASAQGCLGRERATLCHHGAESTRGGQSRQERTMSGLESKVREKRKKITSVSSALHDRSAQALQRYEGEGGRGHAHDIY